MCIDFDGHHSGGSSFDSVIRCRPYPQVPVGFNIYIYIYIYQVKSPSPESRVSETGSDPPIGSDRDSGCDIYSADEIFFFIYTILFYAFVDYLIYIPNIK